MTPCPIQLSSALSQSPEIRGPFRIVPGSAASEFGPKPETYTQIIVIDSKGVEHRYDADALSALRPAGHSLDWWAYADTGLIFLNENPERSKVEQIARQPCDAVQPISR